MKKLSGDTIFGAVFAIAALIMLWLTNTTLPAKAPMGDPGARIFPSAVSIAVFILAVIVIIQSIRNPIKGFEGVTKDPERRQSATRALLVFMDLGLFLVLWNYVPFLAAGFIFLFLQCMIFREKLLFSVIYSAAVTTVLYVMFTVFLKVRLNI